MCQKWLLITLSSVVLSGLLAANVQAHDGPGKHYVVDSSGNPVKSSSGCITSSGSGGKQFAACGDEVMAKDEAVAKADVVEVEVVADPDPMPAKVAGSHSHPANHCTNSVLHVHAVPGAHTHHYSCKSNHMASPRQMVSPKQMAKY